jgi:hypothetical protein
LRRRAAGAGGPASTPRFVVRCRSGHSTTRRAQRPAFVRSNGGAWRHVGGGLVHPNFDDGGRCHRWIECLPLVNRDGSLVVEPIKRRQSPPPSNRICRWSAVRTCRVRRKSRQSQAQLTSQIRGISLCWLITPPFMTRVRPSRCRVDSSATEPSDLMRMVSRA